MDESPDKSNYKGRKNHKSKKKLKSTKNFGNQDNEERVGKKTY